MSADDNQARFESVDWSEVHSSRQILTAERSAALLGLIALTALYLYDTFVSGFHTIGTWRAEPLHYLVLLSVVVLVSYGLVPLVRRPRTIQKLLADLRASPTGIVGVGLLGVFLLVGIFGPLAVSQPELRFDLVFQPPVGFTSTEYVDCAGYEENPGLDSICHGSMEYPLGTNHRGFPMGFLLIEGARIALYITLVTAAFVVPIATGVGVVAGLRGGWVDSLLMSYVDVQLSIPAIVVYFIGYSYYNPSLLLLIVAFGLLSWGGIARLVRSEVIKRRENGHVLVARGLGAPDRYIAWRHIIPNVTNTLVPAVFQLLALLVLFEAGVAFLGFHDISMYSWGSTISESVNAVGPSLMQTRASTAALGEVAAHKVWWSSTVPAVALLTTMLSFKLVGDWLRDALDPRSN